MNKIFTARPFVIPFVILFVIGPPSLSHRARYSGVSPVLPAGQAPRVLRLQRHPRHRLLVAGLARQRQPAAAQGAVPTGGAFRGMKRGPALISDPYIFDTHAHWWDVCKRPEVLF